MYLIHVKRMSRRPSDQLAKVYHIQIQEGDSAWETDLLNEMQLENATKLVVQAILAAPEVPMRNVLGLEAKTIKPLKYGIGLSDDKRSLLRVNNGKVQVMTSDLRWMVAQQLMIIIGRAINNRTFLEGIF